MAELTKAIARLMEERAHAPTEATQHRQLLERLRSGVAAGDRATADSFTRILLQRASPEWVDRHNEEQLLGLCSSAYEFFATPDHEPRIRVFNPEYERDGWDAPVTVVETVLVDRPFIVDTVRDTLHRAGCVIRVFLHPVLGCERDQRQAVVSVGPPESSFRHESFIHAEIERLTQPEALAALESDLRERLNDVLLATNDYQAMRHAAELVGRDLRAIRLSPPLDPPQEEIAAFLEWLRQGNFVFLGYRRYRFSGVGAEQTVVMEAESGLGLLRKGRSSFASPRRVADLSPSEQQQVAHGSPLIVTKTNAESPIHRRARMDCISVRDYDPNGRVRGEHRLIGLFTSRAYAEEAAVVPLLRSKLEQLLAAEDAAIGSHDCKNLVSFFNSMPKEYLFAASVNELREDIRAILAAEGTDDVRVTVRPDPLERGVFVLVVLPRDRFSSDLRRGVEAAAVRTYSATLLHQHVAMDESDQARLHYYLAAPADVVRHPRPEDLRREVQGLMRTWDDRLRDALEQDAGTSQARALAQRYARIFTPEYKAATDVKQAVRDIRHVEAAIASAQPQIDLVNPAGSHLTVIRLYLLNQEIVLSDFLPILENLGLRVFAADPLNVTIPGSGTLHLHSFKVLDGSGECLQLEHIGADLGAAILAHFSGRLPDDRLNTLITNARLSWQQVNLLRTYASHTGQTGVSSRAACVWALARHPELARLLWEYFLAKFDPHSPHAPADRMATILPDLEQQVLARLDAVETVAEDRTLRALFNTIAATVRTNYFASRDDGAVAVKIESKRLDHLPRPKPLFEIFIFAQHMEGIHLRAGRVARGGLRLTDRPDDYRTEILGLMKTQMAKNAIIIPTGAKGGFVARAAAGGVPGRTEVVAAYRTFVSSLLDVTDNIVQGRLVPPGGILYDEPDPYLVVAADKGTATFSDIANEVAEAHDFWLGDAFASGGSRGYDHKKIGITARGAWECVRRHFLEMGMDVDRDPITVVGIGDMSGDVFGNGMLLGSNLRLQAAFNHKHVFLDPAPDPAVSAAERQRLFGLPRSGWDDYNRDCISAGGGVYQRGAKKILLTAEVRAMLGVGAEVLSGEELIRAVLCMPADLLWNGGIGTYAKASFETHVQVEDSVNDNVRVNASDLRVKVVGEGGNLGFTQNARVEFALKGGRINTDAIDNAGGVCMSDHEVNLKIALRSLVESGEITAADRNRLLAELTPEVISLVLVQNTRQALALSLDQTRSQHALKEFLDLMQELEGAGFLDRNLEHLPDREVLRRRRSGYLGLTRPELAVILAHGKLALQHTLLESSLPDDPYAERTLFEYFPRPIVERYRQGVRSHRLRREIIAVQLANGLIDVGGIAFVSRVQQDTGCAAVDVVRAWVIAVALSDAADLYGHVLRRRSPLAHEAEVDTVFRIESALERACKWLIETQNPAESIADLVQRYLGPVYELSAQLPGILSPDARARFDGVVRGLTEPGLDASLAAGFARLSYLAEMLEIVYLSAELEVPVPMTAEIYYRIGSIFDVDWVRDSLAACSGEGRWERRAVEGLSEGLVYARRVITRNILMCRQGGGEVEHCFRDYADANARQIEKVRALLGDVKSAVHPTLPALVVVMREIGRLCGRG